jgi:hypothetical protein
MTVTDDFLEEVMKAVNGESYATPEYVSWSSDAITIDPTASSLTGEYGSRNGTTNVRSGTGLTLSVVKTGATVGSAGERINSMGLFSTSTAGIIMSQALVSSLLQTSDFDVELDWVITAQRRA